MNIKILDNEVEIGRLHWEAFDVLEDYLMESLLMNAVVGLPKKSAYFYRMKYIYKNYEEYCELRGCQPVRKIDLKEALFAQGYDKEYDENTRLFKLDTDLVDWSTQGSKLLQE